MRLTTDIPVDTDSAEVEVGPTVKQVATRYVYERGKRGEFTPATQKTVRNILNGFCDVVGDVGISRLTRRHIAKWLGTLACNASTTRNRLGVVRSFLAWCQVTGLARNNPALGFKPPKEPRRVPRTLRSSELGQVLDACPDARARAIVLMELHLGLRAGEVARAQVGDIDPAARTLLVRGKGGNERVLPIPDQAWAALKAYLAEHPAGSGPLFRSYVRPHEGLSAAYVSGLARRWMAGIKSHAYDGVSGHALRRTCATDLLENGHHVRAVQAVLGHQTLSTTEKYLRRTDALQLRGVLSGRWYGVPHPGDSDAHRDSAPTDPRAR